MKPDQFCYWLQGFFEISDPVELDYEEIKQIKNHLNLVFTHYLDPESNAETNVNPAILQAVHDGKSDEFWQNLAQDYKDHSEDLSDDGEKLYRC